jgi:FkbM family methyltransferase
VTVLRKRIRRFLPRPVKVVLRRWLITLIDFTGIDVRTLGSAAAPSDKHPELIQSAAAAADPSQAGEVPELDALIRDGFPELLVDIGAFDGVTISNSRPYTARGWRAILVEPNPVAYAKLSLANERMANTTCLNVACGDRPGTLPLFLGTDGPESAMSTLCTDQNRWFEIARAPDFVNVEVTTLTDILASSEWPRDFSLLLVDAEGMDYEVLKGLDFDRFRPRIVVTEEYIFNPEKHRNKYRLLLDRDYTFYKMAGCNTFWIANEWVEVCLGLTIPTPDPSSVS